MGIILIILLALVAVLMFNTIKFKGEDITERTAQPVKVNSQRARENLSTLIKFETVSNADFDKTDKEVFAAYRAKLRELYPNVTATAEYKELGNTAMLFKISGKSSENPTVLMSHYDVVPVVEERWEHPPFSGEIIDGVLWGRGTIDTKITMLGIMEALEDLLETGYVPENDLYLSFSGDEEVGGVSAPAVVDYMEANGIAPALVLDEGGAVVEGVFPGVDKPIAVIGIGEKGIAQVEFTATSDGGILSVSLGMKIRMARAIRPTSKAVGLNVPMDSITASSFSIVSTGLWVKVSPRKSLICPIKMVTAIPLVKPVTMV